MNKQEIFNTVYLGLKSQGFKQSARTDADSSQFPCLYRGPDGMKCAVGHLIPDEIYDKSIEHSSFCAFNGEDFRERLPKVFKWAAQFDTECWDMIERLQGVHDSIGNDMQERLEEFAIGCGLTIPNEDN